MLLYYRVTPYYDIALNSLVLIASKVVLHSNASKFRNCVTFKCI